MAEVFSDPTIRPPTASSSVFKDECVFSFQTPELEEGLNVCLHCYQSFAPLVEADNTNFTFLHYSLTGHSIYLNIKRFFQKEVQEERLQKKLKLDRVQILQENEDELYTYEYALVSIDKETSLQLKVIKTATSHKVENPGLPENVKKTIVGILDATSMNLKNDIQSWEQEIKPCKHSENIQQQIKDDYELQSKCSSCDLEENLWICLHCGTIGCGRQQFGGLSGNSHALKHYDYFQHPVAVKLGSLSLKEGKADCYCYECNDEVKVPNLVENLKTFGISINSFTGKNEKTLTELNIQQNLTWQFNMESDSGETLQPVFGTSLVGLKNLGNSCYINSVIQLVTHLRSFIGIFYNKDVMNFEDSALQKPYDDLYVQLIRIFNGLVGDKYSKPNNDSTDSLKWQKGLSLALFKSLIGKVNADFNSQNQQDAFEFLLFFLDQIETYYYKHANNNQSSTCFNENPVSRLKFVLNQQLVLQNDTSYKLRKDINQYLTLNLEEEVDHTDEEGLVHYKKVDINKAVADYFNSAEVIELGNANFVKHITLNSLPDLLLVQIQRAKLVNWVPTKSSVPVTVPGDKINLSQYVLTPSQDKALHASSSLIPEEDVDQEQNNATFEPNQEVMNNLLQMGFPENRCKKALYNVSNSANPEDAMNWLFAHMEDTDIDDPLVVEASSSSSQKNPNEPTEEEINNLVVMGFNSKLVRKALLLNGKNAEAAVEWLFRNPDDDGEIDTTPTVVKQPTTKEQIEGILSEKSVTDDFSPDAGDYYLKGVVCHKGNSIHTGHYVVFLKQLYDDKVQWVLYNDEKVVLANDKKNIEEIEKNGYLFLFVKKGSIDDIFSGK